MDNVERRIVAAFLRRLAATGHQFCAFQSSPASYNFFETQGVDRSELYWLGDPQQMYELDIGVVDNERMGEVIYWVLVFEFAMLVTNARPLHLRQEFGNIAIGLNNSAAVGEQPVTFEEVAEVGLKLFYAVGDYVCRSRSRR